MICGELKKTESLITYVTDRKGHDLRYAIDSTKIQTTLGWQPEVKLADGIQRRFGGIWRIVRGGRSWLIEYLT